MNLDNSNSLMMNPNSPKDFLLVSTVKSPGSNSFVKKKNGVDARGLVGGREVRMGMEN